MTNTLQRVKDHLQLSGQDNTLLREFVAAYEELEQKYINIVVQSVHDRCDRNISAQRVDTWRSLANGYEDIRGWLRLCDNNPKGHKEFYDECSKIIFPDSWSEEEGFDDEEQAVEPVAKNSADIGLR